MSVAGEIDVYTAPSLREQLTELDAQGCSDIVVDMSAVEFLDSTGLGVLVGGLKRARLRGGTLRLVSDQEKILKILRITGLIRVFPIHPTLDEALDVSDVRDVSAGTDGTAVTDVRDVAGLTRDVVPPLPGSAG